MTDWTAGYVTDIGYTQGYYRELAPSMLAFSALSAGMRGPNANAPLTYCELGCGQGLSLNIHAAANPHIEFYGNDFNPAHVAGARALAADAGSTNVRFSDASFETYADEPGLPAEFDIIALHGIYSWISAENRKHIVEFIRRKLKIGGLVFISYNCLPGWSMAAPLRHLMYMYGKMVGGPTLGQLDQAIGFIDRLKATQPAYFRANPGLEDRFAALRKLDRRYLSHEYMNDAWSLLYFSDVNAELAAAKLSFVGTAHLPDRIDAVVFTAEQREVLKGIADPVMRETLKDYVQNQQFRRDLFAKGPVPLAKGDLDEAWMRQRFALGAPRTPDDLKAKVGLGEVALKPEIYDVLLSKFAERAWTVRELLADPAVATMGWQALREALMLLIGLNRLHPALDAAGDAKRAKRTQALNAAIVRRGSGSDLNYLAAPVSGTGHPLGRIEQLLLEARGRKEADPVGAVFKVMAAGHERITRDGQMLDDEAQRTDLTERNAQLDATLPLLRQLGLL